MKIEKVNDRQIRCTLTREDLADRELKISELAYGTDKAKRLFHDMMQQASYEFGFDAEDIPLMIEAIPLNSECIVLIVTKVEDPEELDTRFSKFAPSIHETVDEDTMEDLEELPPVSKEKPFAEEIADLFQKIQKAKSNALPGAAPSAKQPDTPPDPSMTRLFSFHSLQEVIRLAHVLAKEPIGANALYKSDTGAYILSVTMGETTPAVFGKFCSIISEYGDVLRQTSGNDAYFEEHFSPILKQDALQNLTALS